MCSGSLETDSHLFVDCEFAQLVWLEAGINIHKMLELSTSWLDFFGSKQKHVDEAERYIKEKVAMVLWGIWRARNYLVFQSKTLSPTGVVQWAWSLLAEHQKLCCTEAVMRQQHEMEPVQ